MRIIAGKFKGRQLSFAKTEFIRPTMDRVKESLFSALGGKFLGETVLDLFAGSGSLGFEAISRGASKCIFVDKDPKAVAVLMENAIKLDLSLDVAVVLKADWKDGLRLIKKHENKLDLVFLDPPYRKLGMLQNVLMGLASSGIFGSQAQVVVEHEFSLKVMSSEIDEYYNMHKKLAFGDTALTFLKVM